MISSLPFRLLAHFSGDEVAALGDTPLSRIDALTQAFEQAGALVDHYGTRAFAEGMWRLIDPSFSDHAFVLLDDRLSPERRARAIRAIGTLYADVFARHCKAQLSHTLTTVATGHDLNRLCHMFWDILPLHPGTPGNSGVLDQVCLEVLGKILDIPHEACREGALHGIEHWAASYPEAARAAVAGLLASRNAPSPALATIARGIAP